MRTSSTAFGTRGNHSLRRPNYRMHGTPESRGPDGKNVPGHQPWGWDMPDVTAKGYIHAADRAPGGRGPGTPWEAGLQAIDVDLRFQDDAANPMGLSVYDPIFDMDSCTSRLLRGLPCNPPAGPCVALNAPVQSQWSTDVGVSCSTLGPTDPDECGEFACRENRTLADFNQMDLAAHFADVPLEWDEEGVPEWQETDSMERGFLTPATLAPLQLGWALLRENLDLVRWTICRLGQPPNDCVMGRLTRRRDYPVFVFENQRNRLCRGNASVRPGWRDRIHFCLTTAMPPTTYSWALLALANAGVTDDIRLCVAIEMAAVILHEMMHACDVDPQHDSIRNYNPFDSTDYLTADTCTNSHMAGTHMRWALLTRYPDALNAPCCLAMRDFTAANLAPRGTVYNDRSVRASVTTCI